jgi:hypothetical protein
MKQVYVLSVLPKDANFQVESSSFDLGELYSGVIKTSFDLGELYS